MTNKKILGAIVIIILLVQTACSGEIIVSTGKSSFMGEGVTISDRGNYYDVVLDFSSGLSHGRIGETYAKGILEVVPDYVALLDSYLDEQITNKDYYKDIIARCHDIKKHVREEYLDEIEAMARIWSETEENIAGDGKLSKDEVYLFNLLPDAYRPSQCSAVAVFKERSATGKNIIGRNLDWFGGSKKQIPRIQSIITMKYKDKNVCFIGYMGYMGAITGFNDSKIFAAIVDSPTGVTYTSQGKRSYTMDLRYALETKSSINEVFEYMADPYKYYAFNHNIILGDPDETKIFENNISGDGIDDKPVQRALRSSDSPLNDEISWGISNAIGCVNSFMLKGNHDNHTSDDYNTKRWNNMRKQLLTKGETVTVDELKDVICYDNGTPGNFQESGDLYNKLTQYTVIFQPDTMELEVAFPLRDKPGYLKDPQFEKIKVFNQ
jgi:hypothetical protein